MDPAALPIPDLAVLLHALVISMAILPRTVGIKVGESSQTMCMLGLVKGVG